MTATDHNRDHYGMNRSRGSGRAVADISRACLIRLIDFPEMPLRTGISDVIKAGRTALLVRTELPVAGRMVPVAYKCIRRRNWLKRLAAPVRRDRALRSWRLGRRLLATGVPTARPLAVIIPRPFATRGESYLVTEWICGAVDLHAFCRSLERLGELDRARRANAVAASLGRLLGRMHARRVSHRDLKPGNLLIVEDSAAAAEEPRHWSEYSTSNWAPVNAQSEATVDAMRAVQVPPVSAYIVDLDGAAIRSRLTRRVRVRNLSRLIVGIRVFRWVSRSMRLRFLKAYLREAGDDELQWKPFWRSLDASVAARLARMQRKAA